MPLISRYNTQIKGAMTFTGNTVGLSKLAGTLQAGTLGSIGAFTSLNTGLQVPTFPAGTTLNINQNGSAAVLSLPVGSTVVRAELIWGGSYYYRYQQNPPGITNTIVDISAQINNPVQFTTPTSGGSVTVFPDVATAQEEYFTFNDGTGQRTVRFYMRSADVTALVTAGGTYATEQIVGILEAQDNLAVATNHAGWTLAVVYENPSMIERALYLWVGAQIVDIDMAPSVDIPITGFMTKPSGSINARLLLSAQEGDANITGDRMYFGPTVGSLTNIFGPNNPIANFFASQINDDNGNLNTTGTFGNLNANAAGGTQIVDGRQGWDITNINVSSQMLNNQSSAIIRLTTTGDAYMMNATGLQVDVLKLDTDVVKTVDLAYADLGDLLTYTISITNRGNVPMTNLILTDSVPSGATFVADSVKIDAVITPGVDPNSGINLGTLTEGNTVVITFEVEITSIPSANPMENSADIIYHYSPTLTTTDQSNTVQTRVNHASVTPVKSVSKSYAQLGETLTYTTVLSNTGTTVATNLFFSDSLPGGVTFVNGSVRIDGSPEITLDPTVGFSVIDIPAGSNRIISFDVVVANSFPVINPIPNTSEISYGYRIDPLGPVINVPSVLSNQVTTQINEAVLEATKAVDKTVATFGEVVTYTTTLTNLGNVVATQLQFVDAVPQGMTLVGGSVSINGVLQPLLSPNVGFVLPNLLAGSSHVISFGVTVDEGFPSINPIPNVSGVNYSYLVDPLGVPVNPITTISNQVLTQVNDSLLVAIKSVDKVIVDVGEILNYTVSVINQGNISATGVSFQDNLPVGVSFVGGSVTIDTITEPLYDPEVGFALSDIAAGDSVLISFNVLIEGNLPVPLTIQNQAVIRETNKADVVSNSVTTQIKHASIQAVKQVDQSYTDLSGVIRYTLTLTNVGNTPADGVVVTDSMPVDTTFIPGSVTIEGVTQPTADPTVGIMMGTLLVGEVVVITFRVVVKGDLPVSSPIQNNAVVDYQYVVDPLNPPVVAPQITTNTVSTVVNTARINTVKEVDKAIVDLEGNLVYTMTLNNVGTTDAQNTILYDVIPVGTALINGSVSVGGVAQPLANPAVGILVGTIGSGATQVVSFSVKVDSIMPIVNPLRNRSTTSYEYFVDPLATHVNGPASTSNEVSTLVAHATLDIYKSVNTLVATLGDTLSYTVVVANTGNIDADNAILTDTVPLGTSFAVGSVSIDGVVMPGVDPGVGIALGTIAAGDSVSIEFSVTIGAVLPVPNPMPNSALINYEYIFDLAEPPVVASKISNRVQTLVIEQGDFASLTVVKSVDKNYSQLGDTLRYEIVITNTGNTDALDLVVTDPLQTGITFVPGSVEVGGVTRPFEDIEVGVPIILLAVGDSVSVSFEVTVNGVLPPINPIPNEALVSYSFRTDPNLDPISGPVANSNKVDTFIYTVNIGTLKGANLHFADIDSIITYTIGVANLGTAAAKNVTITDSMPTGVVFIPGSVTIDGIPSLLANPETGINIGTVSANTIILVTYNVQVAGVIPIPNPVMNTAQIDYEYLLDPIGPLIPGYPIITAPVSTQINHGEITLSKLADIHYADWNQEITYTITVENSGNVVVTDINVTDNIPQGAQFIVGSVIVGGNNEPLMAPHTGMSIPTLGVGESRLISFRVKVDEGFPPVNPIPNEANSTYAYKVDPSDTDVLASSAPSNTEEVQINHGHLNVIKEQDRDYVDLGEEITYTLTLTQVGNVKLTQIQLVDAVPEGTEFVEGSVVIGGIIDLSANPNNGVNVPDLEVGQSIVVTFRVRIISLPIINPMPNEAVVQYQYRVNPLDPVTSITEAVESNIVLAWVNHAQIVTSKSVSKEFVGLNEVLVYTILVRNIGSTLAEQVMLIDNLPTGVNFVGGSVEVGGIVRPLDDPTLGIALGSIGVGVIVPVKLSVRVGNNLPVPNPIINRVEVSYEYRVDPNDLNPVIPPVVISNEVSTLVKLAKIIANKSNSVDFADVGEVVVYTITLTNEGNVTAGGVVLVDTLVPGISFVTDSVKVGGVLESGANPISGINLPDILAGASLEISFEVRIGESIPDPNPVLNAALVYYSYQVDPNSTPVVGEPALTNQTFIEVNTGQVLIEKSADHIYKDLGDILTYTFTLTHIGNVEAQSLRLTDLLEVGTAFVEGSVIVGGVSDPVANPEVGITLSNMMPGEVRLITFEARVTDIPQLNPINNSGLLEYAYQLTPQLPLVPHSINSNVTEVYVLHAQLETIKSVNKEVTSEGEVLTYRLEVTNTGNVSAQNVLVQDAMPQGTDFVPGSVVIDGVEVINADPNRGIELPNIEPGITHYLTFKVKVGEEAPNPIINTIYTTYAYAVDPTHPLKLQVSESNEVSVVNIRAQISLVKTASKDLAAVGDEITYMFTATNTGEINLEEVIIKDLLEEQLDFIEGSVVIQGFNRPLENILTGVSIGKLSIGEVKTILFKAKVIKKIREIISNQGTANLFYKLGPGSQIYINEQNSNLVNILVEAPDLIITKEADTKIAQLGQIITYHVTLVNTGDTTLLNIVFKDELPRATLFIENSLTLNGITINDVNLEKGINIGELGIGMAADIMYQVKVKSGSCNGIIENSAYAVYEYQLGDHTTGRQMTEKVSVRVVAQMTSFKQAAISTLFEIPKQKPDMEEVDDISVDILIRDTYVIKTVEQTSNEGQHLSGYKLMIHGDLQFTLEYTANSKSQPMHSAHFTMPFTNFIILPSDYIEGQSVEVMTVVEDSQGITLDERVIEANVMVLLIAKVLD